MSTLENATQEEKDILSDLKKAKARYKDPDRFDEVCTADFWIKVADVLARCLKQRIHDDRPSGPLA
jgi:hypothetical protein